jgi:hypothetical protein
MIKAFVCLLVAGFALLSSAAEPGEICPPHIQWQQTYGSGGPDEPYAVRQTSDGGFIIGGTSYSSYAGSGNRTAPGWGGSDFWIVRTDAAGSNLWDRAYGSMGTEGLSSLEQTTDGGFILAGGSSSLGPSGNKTANSYGLTDFWLVRTDSAGNKLWDVAFGGQRGDAANSVRQTSDGGFVVAGVSTSHASGNKTSVSWGGADFWVVRLDANGQKLWDQSFGGSQSDTAGVVRETADGGFIVGGYTDSGADGNKSSASFGFSDFWVVRLDGAGNKLWDRSFGGNWSEYLRSLVQTADGGFLLAGQSTSFPSGNKRSPLYGSYDWWVIRVDANGGELWQRSYGGTDYDILLEVNRTADGGFILSGSSDSRTNGTKTARRYGSTDYWLVRINGSGNQLWDQTLGSRGEDTAAGAQQTADGGFIVAGLSYADRGNKTSPTFGNGDFWVVKFQAETPDDCDGDGVPNAQDLCADTPPGTVINSSGCAIVQLCPCTNDWQTTREYVRCVRDAADDFARAGLITEAERQAIVGEAERTNCPPNFLRPGIIAFGLTNVPLGQAELDGGSGGTGTGSGGSGSSGAVTVSELGIEGLDGVSVLTGEADSGLFLYPYADIWGNFSDDWFMLGKAYGRVGGTANALVSSMRVTKPHYETYPVAIDFTPLRPRSLTFQVFSNGTLVAEATTEGGTGGITVSADTYESPRGNPFWRMADGSIGAIIEFTTPLFGSGEYHRNSISGPFGEAYGDQIFIRANQPANVEFISRVDVTGFSGEFNTFSFLDERLGMFRRPHEALGPVTMTAANRRLTIAGLPDVGNQFGGVLVELDLVSRFDVDLLPLELADTDTAFLISGSGPTTMEDEENPGSSFAMARLHNENDALELSSYFSREYTGTNANSPLQVRVYRNGSLAGTAIASNNAIAGTLTSRMEGKVPEIISAGIVANASNAPGYVALSFRHLTTFTATDGTVLRGNHLRIGPIVAAPDPLTIDGVSVGTYNVLAFTITAERSILAPPPMSAVTASTGLELTWPTVNAPFIVESAPSISGPFSVVTNDVEYIDEKNCLILPVEATGSRFFRLRLSPD